MHKIAVEHFQHENYTFSTEYKNPSNDGVGDLSREFFNGNYINEELLNLRALNKSTRVTAIVNPSNNAPQHEITEYPYL